jgi:hypothetical protein
MAELKAEMKAGKTAVMMVELRVVQKAGKTAVMMVVMMADTTVDYSGEMMVG